MIASTWRLSLSTDDASTSTDPIRKTDQRRVGTRGVFKTRRPRRALTPSPATRADLRTRPRASRTPPRLAILDRVQSYGTAERGVQTEGSALTRQGEMRLEALSESGKTRLLAFLEAAVPQMEHALAENEQSATFDDDVVAAAALEDDTARAPECVHALDPRPSTSAATGSGDATGSDARRGGATRDERFWRDLVPTGVSWNRSGFSLAVSYGRFDVTGWCDSPGALCVCNLRRSDVDPRKPDFLFETDSCLQCVAFHPADPAVVAAGSRSVINPSRVSNARSTNTPSSSLIHTIRPGRSSGASVRRAVTTTGTGLSASGASGASGASDTLNSISSAFHHAPTSPHRPKRTSDPGRFHPVSVIAVLSAQRSARPSAGGANDAGFVRSEGRSIRSDVGRS